MDTQFIVPFIQTLQSFSAEGVSVILYMTCLFAILLLFKLYGAQGLFLYNIVAVIASNIQVLRTVQFGFSIEPVALGTIVFASTYLCSDILTEHFGKDAAKKGVWYSFAAQILMTVLMIIAIGYPSLTDNYTSNNPEMALTEKALALLFTPSPRLLIASLIAFAVSQLTDIWLFQSIQKLTRGQKLWLRTGVSALISAMVDNILFSTLAWVVLAPNPVSFSTLLFTYILGTFVTRALMALFALPVMYLSYYFTPLNLRSSLSYGP